MYRKFRLYSQMCLRFMFISMNDIANWEQCTLRFFFRLFSINGAGEVRLTGVPATLSKGSYELFLVVRDNGEPHRQDSAVVIVVVNAVSGQVEQAPNQEMNMVAIILLSVVCGCLLLIIAILVVYIYKK